MIDPFENEEEDWVEISDAQGRKASLRHLATVQFGDKTYYVLGAIRESKSGDEGGFLLVRQDRAGDGAKEYVITHDEDEIEQVVSRFVFGTLLDHAEGSMEDVSFGDEVCPCGENHNPGEFCYCDMPEYLQ